MQSRAFELLPTDRSSPSGLCLVVAGGPGQQVLRPSEIEDSALAKEIHQQALFGAAPVFVGTEGVQYEVSKGALIIEQRSASVLVDPLGSVRILVPPRQDDGGRSFDLPVLIEEDVEERLLRSLRLAGWVLDRIDPSRRIGDVVPVAALLGQGYWGWKTRVEHERSRGTMQMGQAGERILAQLTPASRRRTALLHDTQTLGRDLTVLLRREVRG